MTDEPDDRLIHPVPIRITSIDIGVYDLVVFAVKLAIALTAAAAVLAIPVWFAWHVITG